MTEPLRYGLIGTGMMGLEHQRNLNALPGADVVAAADPEPTSLEWASLVAENRPLQLFTDYRELLEADLCDVYVISTPNYSHRDVLHDVMTTSRHIFVEKPMCTSIVDTQEIAQRALNYPALFWVGLEYRYMPPVARAIEMAQNGALGSVRTIAIREHRHPFLKKVGDWNRFNRFTGGTLVEKCCHFFDLMRLIARGTPVAVTGIGGQAVNHLDERYDGETPDILDSAFVAVEFDNGVRASLDLCMFAEGSLNNEELAVVGDLGKVESFLPSSTVRYGLRSGWGGGVTEETVRDTAVEVEGFHHGASYLEHIDVMTAIREGTPAKVSADDGLWSVVLGAAAHLAINERAVIDPRELLRAQP